MFKNKRFSTIFLVFTFLAITAFLEYNGYIWHTDFFTLNYKIKGLDVSHYQKDIDWKKIPLEKYKFIFIKATEGSDMIDHKFKYNWKEARQAGFLAGAYHFFTTSSSGKKQAKNFIRMVPVIKNSLPPVIDIEIDTQKDKEQVRKHLTDLINLLTKHYKKKPILYVTHDTYDAFIPGQFKNCHIWIRNIFMHPTLKDDRKWIFWQYSNRGRVTGINTFVDINVFYATEAELKKL